MKDNKLNVLWGLVIALIVGEAILFTIIFNHSYSGRCAMKMNRSMGSGSSMMMENMKGMNHMMGNMMGMMKEMDGMTHNADMKKRMKSMMKDQKHMNKKMNMMMDKNMMMDQK